MKKLLLLLFVTTLLSVNAQNENNQNINLSVENKNSFVSQMSEGIYDNKDGTVTVVEVGGTGFVSLNSLRKRSQKSIVKYTKAKNLDYKYISETTRKSTIGVFPKVWRVYQLLNLDGTPVITKSFAISKIKELKELLDMGIITNEEFKSNSAKYKKVILEN